MERFADTYTCDYGGTGMTLIGSINNGTAARVAIYELLSPAVGTANITLTASGTVRRWIAYSIDFAGVDQVTSHGTAATGTGTSTSPSCTVTSATGETVIGGVAAQNDTNSITGSVGAGQTEDVNLASSNGTSNGVRGIGSDESGSSSVTHSYTITSALWAVAAIGIKPASAVAVVPSLALLGVGV
jgi:hypothetical protein